MLIKRKAGWEIPESLATPESVFWNRRALIAAMGGSALALAACDQNSDTAEAVPAEDAKETAKDVAMESDGLYPVPQNTAYTLDRPITDEKESTSRNNYYEFESLSALIISQRIAKEAQKLPIRPWDIKIDGLVEQPFTIGFEDLLKKVELEERLYRHRCVEAWAMAVPWSGFPMKALVDMARPLSSAKFVKMETFYNPEVAPGQARSSFYRTWPYTEGITIEEATNDMAFLVTGMYGHEVPKQNGAPIRLALPWKYGFKSIKGIVRFEFVDKQPVSFWEENQGSEYGFWANVNPDVPHKRWSQATEKMLGTDKEYPTQIFNGYGEQVAHLYKGMDPKVIYF